LSFPEGDETVFAADGVVRVGLTRVGLTHVDRADRRRLGAGPGRWFDATGVAVRGWFQNGIFVNATCQAHVVPLDRAWFRSRINDADQTMTHIVPAAV
jgi:hypothetical protein